MLPNVMEHYSGFPQKLVDLEWLESELHGVCPAAGELGWNSQLRCVEHRFGRDWEEEYAILKQWAEHVGAQFKMTGITANGGAFMAYIYR